MRILMIFVVLLSFFFVQGCFYADAEPIVSCTQDMKHCPNGGMVAREGPKCEFAPCLTDVKKQIDYFNPKKDCTIDADCVVKNVGNCCGYYPQCVHKDAVVDAEAVSRECAKRGEVSICGFQDIEYCACIANQCQAR